MTTTIEAIYENGKLVLPRPLSLPEKSHVRVTVESGTELVDAGNPLLDKTRRNRILRELDDSEGW
jgi:predicted DNA-binding antitoxin AbrB/MazE fold protein